MWIVWSTLMVIAGGLLCLSAVQQGVVVFALGLILITLVGIGCLLDRILGNLEAASNFAKKPKRFPGGGPVSEHRANQEELPDLGEFL